MNTRFGEMMDLISCLAIYQGRAEEAKKKKNLTFEEVLEMK